MTVASTVSTSIARGGPTTRIILPQLVSEHNTRGGVYVENVQNYSTKPLNGRMVVGEVNRG